MKRLYNPQTLITGLFFVAVWLFLWLSHPEYLSYAEQYQLFLFTGEYFTQRIAVVGGLADYIGEFINQFGLVPAIAAALIALVLTSVQILSGVILTRLNDKRNVVIWWLLGLVPAIALAVNAGDINMLMSAPVALMISLLVSLSAHGLSKLNTWLCGIAVLLIFTVLYWLVGPLAIAFVAIVITGRGKNNSLVNSLIFAVAELLLCAAVIFVINRMLFVQYPESSLFFGINYYRIPGMHPLTIYMPAIALIVLCTLAIFAIHRRVVSIVSALLGVLFVVVYGTTTDAYNDDVSAILRYDYLVRNERWLDIIRMAETRRPVNEFELQALNLALAKTGQLGDRMFQWQQRGIESLLSPYKLDNMSCLITAEAFYHLGLINEALRYNFDLQEAIMNDRKSGRFMRRVAECMIVNGNYKVAEKYISMLEHSLYYRNWAKASRRLLNDDTAVDNHPLYGHLRKIRLKQEMLFVYPEIEKILGFLAFESNGTNRLAWDYFNAAMLLKGDLPTFTGMYHYANEMFGQLRIPRHWQEAIAMYWTFSHQNFDGIPYPVDQEVRQMISHVAGIVMRNTDSTTALAAFDDTYPVYFLKHRTAEATTLPDHGASHTHE